MPTDCPEDPVRRISTALLAVIATLAGLTIALAPASAAPKPPAPPAPTATAARTSLPSASVTLITGDQVVVTHHDGWQAITTTAADRGPDAAPVSFSTFVMRGDTYVLPSDASAYAGIQLGWSLFDISALIRGGLSGGAA